MVRPLPYKTIKRAIDIAGSAALLGISAPAFVVISAMIKRESDGPVFFVHERVGLNGKPIRIYKFRSMRTGSEDLEAELTDEDLEKYYREFKLKNDPRITETGHKLRRISADELPQLFNVIRGDMSLVGPRPVTAEELKFYSDDERARLLSVKPGLTGYWQVNDRSDATYQSGRRQQMELYYVDNKSLLMDLGILLKTPLAVIRKRGAY